MSNRNTSPMSRFNNASWQLRESGNWFDSDEGRAEMCNSDSRRTALESMNDLQRKFWSAYWDGVRASKNKI